MKTACASTRRAIACRSQRSSPTTKRWWRPTNGGWRSSSMPQRRRAWPPSVAWVTTCSRRARRPRTEQVTEGVTQQVEAEDGEGDGDAGEQRDPPGDSQKPLRVVCEVAPAHPVRVAESDEAQTRFQQDHASGIERDHDEGGWKRAREHVAD